MAGNSWIFRVKSKGVKKAGKDVKKLKSNMNDLGSSVKKLAVGFGALYVGTKIIGGLTRGLRNLATSSIETAGQFETLRTRLEFMYGSVERGAEVFDTFNDIAATTPFALQNVVEAGAGLKAFGADAENLIKPVADLAAFMGVDVVDAANAMGRAFAGGAGAADVLRDKGILQLIKDSQGIIDLTKLTLPEFRDAMVKTLADPSVGILGATDKLSKTWAGQVSNFKDGIDRIKAAIGEQLIKKLKPLIEDINAEFAIMGEIGWDHIGNAIIDNWKDIFKLMSGVFLDAGILAGKSFALGLGAAMMTTYEDIGDQIIGFGLDWATGIAQVGTLGLWGNIVELMGYAPLTTTQQRDWISGLGSNVDDLIEAGAESIKKDFEEKVGQYTLDISDLVDTIKTDAITKSEEEPLWGFGEMPEPEFDFTDLSFLDELKEQTQVFISLKQFELDEFKKTLDKQKLEYEAANIAKNDIDKWYNDAVAEFKKKQAKLDDDGIVHAKTIDDLKFAIFKAGLDEQVEAYKEAGISKAETDAWVAQQTKKYDAEVLDSKLSTVSGLMTSMGKLNKQAKGNAKISAGLAMVAALIDTYSAANKALAAGVPPWNYIQATAVTLAGLANVMSIKNSMKSLAEGGSFVTNGAEVIMVGDNPSGRERVEVTPLDATGSPTAGGSGVNVTFTGNVMSQDFIENEAIPQIKEAIRRGADIGVG